MLKKDFMVDFDDAGSIGKRYRREDEIGTPCASPWTSRPSATARSRPTTASPSATATRWSRSVSPLLSCASTSPRSASSDFIDHNNPLPSRQCHLVNKNWTLQKCGVQFFVIFQIRPDPLQAVYRLTKRKSPTFRSGLVDDIGLEPMTFRTSKEFPTGRCIPVGKNTAFFGGKSVNRVDPIGTILSYRGRINKSNFEGFEGQIVRLCCVCTSV